MKNKKFMFFENFLEAISQLPEEERAVACYEFCKYGISGELPQNKYLAMFCLGVSASVQKYQGSGGKREGAGAPIGNKNAKKQVDNTINQINQNNQIKQINQIQQTETETETETKNRKKENIKKKKVFTDEFERWWSEVPKKVSKDEAFRKFNTIIAGKIATFDELFTGMKKYATYCREENKEDKFIKHPSTWLNQGCWKDEYKTSKPTFDDLF